MFLNTAQAADFIGLSAITLARWRGSGEGPPFCKLGGAVRYRREDIEAFAAASLVKSTSERPGRIGVER